VFIENHFEIGELDDNPDTDNDETTDEKINTSSSEVNNQFIAQHEPSNGIPDQRVNSRTETGEMIIGTLQRLYGLNVSEGWDVGTSAEEMKHQILLGLRVGFCGAISTWSSWNSAMISLLQRGKIGEALVGYALGIQLGVVCYRCTCLIQSYDRSICPHLMKNLHFS
jgi:fluoride ion exporter CrcB/FEX